MNPLIKQTKIPVDKIFIPERQRREYKEIDSLADNIKAVGGLLHPIIVTADAPDGYLYTLLVGGRRLTAHKKLELTEIEANIADRQLDELEVQTIELMENVAREDLTWQERIDAEEKIHTLQQKLKDSGTQHTIADTAKLLGRNESIVSRDLKLAKAIKQKPEIAKAKTLTDARKMVAAEEEAIIKKELARRAEKRTSTDGVDKVRADMVKGYIIGDAFEQIKKLPDGCIDIVELDPPYGVDYKKVMSRAQDVSINLTHFNDIESEDYPKMILAAALEAYRVMRDSSWLICWCGITTLDVTKYALKEAGFKVAECPALWVKPKQGRCMTPDYKLTVDYEPFIYARKGDAFLHRKGATSIYTGQSERGGHPTSKPIGVLEQVLDTFSYPGQRLLSMFLGSGNIILAARNKGIDAFGFELQERFRDDFILKVDSWVPKKELDIEII